MTQHRCPYCRAPFAPFNLLENDPLAQIVFANATIEAGLDPVGLRCTVNRSHEFGTKEGRLVEISPKISREYIDPPDPTFEERANSWLAEFVFDWFNWAPLPKRTWKFLREQLLEPWSVAESWYVAYDPDKPWKSPEEEAAFIAGAEADQLGEVGGWEEPENDFVSPYADMDDGWDEPDDREERRQDELDAEDNDPAAWAEHAADEADRDHGTHFWDEEDEEEDPWDTWNDDDQTDEDEPTDEEPPEPNEER